MSYTCPDCEDGVLVAKVREIQIKDDETVEIVDGRVRITSVGCNNGCSSESEEEEQPKKKKRQSHGAGTKGEPCSKSDLCSRPNGHTGRHDTKLAEKVEA